MWNVERSEEKDREVRSREIRVRKQRKGNMHRSDQKDKEGGKRSEFICK
jgi:hypothetical protein